VLNTFPSVPSTYIRFFPLDVDGDKNWDFVKADISGGFLVYVVFHSNGGGLFTAQVLQTTTSLASHYYFFVYPLDINGDGKGDFVFGWQNNQGVTQPTAYLGNGLLFTGKDSVGNMGINQVSVPIDLNGDGYSDFVSLGFSPGSLYIQNYFGNVDGSLTMQNAGFYSDTLFAAFPISR